METELLTDAMPGAGAGLSALVPAQREPSPFEELLLRELKPKTDTAKQRVKDGLQTLLDQASLVSPGELIENESLAYIDELISQIDQKLAQQINAILHDPKFQELEGTWLGLKHLVSNSETGPMLKIRAFDISKKDMGRVLRRFEDKAWTNSPIFKMVYGAEYGTLGGEPYGCLVADYAFGPEPEDMALLREISKIAAAAHAPFIAGAAPALLDCDNDRWGQLNDKRELTSLFSGAAYTSWRSLRQSEDARYVGLVLPRFLARHPYGPQGERVQEFAFHEDTTAGDSSSYAWSNAAFAMAANINKSFVRHGWCSQINGANSGGKVEGLPCPTFESGEGGIDIKCPTEIAITDQREAELARLGLISLVHRKNTDEAVFISAQSIQSPKQFDSAEATANAALATRLPYIFASSRFAHYLKCMVRDNVGSYKERAQLENWLTRWINDYIAREDAQDSVKAERPLSAAKVHITEVEGQPGYYDAIFELRPHFKLEGLKVSLRMVSKLGQATR